MSNPFNYFNLSDFKKWIENQSIDESQKNSSIGKIVRAKNNIENFEEKIEIEVGDENEIVQEFLKKGGKVTEQDKNRLMIEVSSGSFICHKRFLKKII